VSTAHEVRACASFSCQAQSWKKTRRMVAKSLPSRRRGPNGVQARFTRALASSSPTWCSPAERVVAFYNQRGAAEQWIKEGRARSNECGYHAASSPSTPSAFSFMRSLTTAVILCARW
jgi:hypothetical protein